MTSCGVNSRTPLAVRYSSVVLLVSLHRRVAVSAVSRNVSLFLLGLTTIVVTVDSEIADLSN